MREIKFKYYWQHSETGCIVSTVLTLGEISDGEVNIWNNKLNRYGLPFAIVSYTGVKDANGTDIYEGDIVAWGMIDDDISSANGYGKVEYWDGDACFEIEDIQGVTNGISKQSHNQIIGNIYENPELLETNDSTTAKENK